jgi:hypothetical protein
MARGLEKLGLADELVSRSETQKQQKDQDLKRHVEAYARRFLELRFIQNSFSVPDKPKSKRGRPKKNMPDCA